MLLPRLKCKANSSFSFWCWMKPMQDYALQWHHSISLASQQPVRVYRKGLKILLNDPRKL